MPYDPKKHHRRSIRLKGYDYSQEGLYFVTICVKDRKCLFGKVVNGEMILNDAGKMVENEWLKIPQRFPNVRLHEYVVMPNHFHGIVEIVGATLVVDPSMVTPPGVTMDASASPPPPPPPPPTLGQIVGAFQSIVTVEYIRGVKQLGWTPFNGKLWQRNYWEHIIRDEKAYNNIAAYIINNPKNWKGDKFYGT